MKARFCWNLCLAFNGSFILIGNCISNEIYIITDRAASSICWSFNSFSKCTVSSSYQLNEDFSMLFECSSTGKKCCTVQNHNFQLKTEILTQNLTPDLSMCIFSLKTLGNRNNQLHVNFRQLK